MATDKKAKNPSPVKSRNVNAAFDDGRTRHNKLAEQARQVAEQRRAQESTPPPKAKPGTPLMESETKLRFRQDYTRRRRQK